MKSRAASLASASWMSLKEFIMPNVCMTFSMTLSMLPSGRSGKLGKNFRSIFESDSVCFRGSAVSFVSHRVMSTSEKRSVRERKNKSERRPRSDVGRKGFPMAHNTRKTRKIGFHTTSHDGSPGLFLQDVGPINLTRTTTASRMPKSRTHRRAGIGSL
jgi:hypothetical protein